MINAAGLGSMVVNHNRIRVPLGTAKRLGKNWFFAKMIAASAAGGSNGFSALTAVGSELGFLVVVSVVEAMGSGSASPSAVGVTFSFEGAFGDGVEGAAEGSVEEMVEGTVEGTVAGTAAGVVTSGGNSVVMGAAFLAAASLPVSRAVERDESIGAGNGCADVGRVTSMGLEKPSFFRLSA